MLSTINHLRAHLRLFLWQQRSHAIFVGLSLCIIRQVPGNQCWINNISWHYVGFRLRHRTILVPIVRQLPRPCGIAVIRVCQMVVVRHRHLNRFHGGVHAFILNRLRRGDLLVAVVHVGLDVSGGLACNTYRALAAHRQVHKVSLGIGHANLSV